MCRWLAYTGQPLCLSTLLTRSSHSLIDQSLRARENIVTTNGDGFGIGWYGQGISPGTFHDTHPAWNNQNLKHIAAHISAPLFLAHVRAATGSPVQQTNCHPFAYGKWLFQHNGSVPEFNKMKRQLLFDVDPALFPLVTGSTDSEIFFYLALTFGLQRDPKHAVEKTIEHVERVRLALGIERPLTMSAALSDGKVLYAVRYASHGTSPTLYHSNHVHALKAIDGTYDYLPPNSVVILSEPIDDLPDHWSLVPEGSFIRVVDGEVKIDNLDLTA